MRNIVNGSIVGVVVGLGLSIFFSYLFASGKYYPMSPFSFSGEFLYERVSETTVLVLALICWILIGILFTIVGKVFQRDDWNLLKMTVVHMALVILFFLPLSIASGWYPLTFSSIMLFIVIFIIVYTIIWIAIFTVNKMSINKINAKIKE